MNAMNHGNAAPLERLMVFTGNANAPLAQEIASLQGGEVELVRGVEVGYWPGQERAIKQFTLLERAFRDTIAFSNVVNGTGSWVLTDDLEVYERILAATVDLLPRSARPRPEAARELPGARPAPASRPPRGWPRASRRWR